MSQIEMGSLFSGIGGFDLAAERAGMSVAWQSEIHTSCGMEGCDKAAKSGRFASRVLEHHWPNVPNLGDIHVIQKPRWVDVLAGGFPCQSYSVAGTRGGLADDRGALWWEYQRLIDSIRPTWVVGENVPGLLSSRGGADFETIIRSLTDLGYGVAWSVLDAQYFGVAQRRRRVFIVGHSGGIPRPEILALAEGMSGYPEPSREARQDTAATLESRPTSDRLRAERGHIVGFSPYAIDPVPAEDIIPTMSGRHGDQGAIVHAPEVAGSLTSRDDKGPREDIAEPNMVTYVSKLAQTGSNGLGFSGKDIDGEETAHTLDSSGPEAVMQIKSAGFSPGQGSKSGSVGYEDEQSPTLKNQHGGNTPAVITAFAQNQRAEVRDLGDRAGALAADPGMKQQTYVAEVSHTLRENPRNNSDPLTEAKQHVYEGINVRKLTPLECERLQGFPDGWTAIPKNSDTQRYKQLGNAVAVPVVEWIMRRIAATYHEVYLDEQEDSLLHPSHT